MYYIDYIVPKGHGKIPRYFTRKFKTIDEIVKFNFTPGTSARTITDLKHYLTPHQQQLYKSKQIAYVSKLIREATLKEMKTVNTILSTSAPYTTVTVPILKKATLNNSTSYPSNKEYTDNQFKIVPSTVLNDLISELTYNPSNIDDSSAVSVYNAWSTVLPWIKEGLIDNDYIMSEKPPIATKDGPLIFHSQTVIT